MTVNKLKELLEDMFYKMKLTNQSADRTYYYPKRFDKTIDTLKYYGGEEVSAWFSLFDYNTGLTKSPKPYYKLYVKIGDFRDAIVIEEVSLATFIKRVEKEFYIEYIKDRPFEIEQMSLF